MIYTIEQLHEKIPLTLELLEILVNSSLFLEEKKNVSIPDISIINSASDCSAS